MSNKRPAVYPGEMELPQNPRYTFVFWFFFFRCDREDSNRAAARSAASKATVRLCLARGSQPVGMSNKRLRFTVRPGGFEQQRRRPQPAAETGRSCWGRVLIFQSPAKGLQKNQQTQPVRPCAAGQAISPVGCCLVRGSQPVGMSNKRLRFTVRREDSSYPFLFFIQMRYSPSVMRVSRYRMGVRQASRMAAGRLPVA